MKLRRILIVILALALAAGVYFFFATRQDNSRGLVTLWYEKNSPLAAEIEKLVTEYNADMTRETLPVETKCFDSEKELAEAYETGTPDILLCSHLRAFSLFGREKLTDISAEESFTAPAYPQSILSRSESIGKSFFPVGISVPVMVINNSRIAEPSFDSFEDVFAAASNYKAATGKTYFACESAAELCCLYMLRFGKEFGGDFDKLSTGKETLELYNTFAEASFEGSIAYLENGIDYLVGGAIPCVFTSSEKLCGKASDSLTLYDVPAPAGSENNDTLGTAYGFAVTNGGCGSKRDTAAFISWVFSGLRGEQAALECMLVPPAAVKGSVSGPAAPLAGIAEDRYISLPDPDGEYIRNKADFEERFVKEMERVMP